jgi:hypothetical protein
LISLLLNFSGYKKSHNPVKRIVAVNCFVHFFCAVYIGVVTDLRVAALVRLKIEDVSLNDTGIPLDFDFPALLAK